MLKIQKAIQTTTPQHVCKAVAAVLLGHDFRIPSGYYSIGKFNFRLHRAQPPVFFRCFPVSIQLCGGVGGSHFRYSVELRQSLTPIIYASTYSRFPLNHI